MILPLASIITSARNSKGRWCGFSKVRDKICFTMIKLLSQMCKRAQNIAITESTKRRHLKNILKFNLEKSELYIFQHVH